MISDVYLIICVLMRSSFSTDIVALTLCMLGRFT